MFLNADDFGQIKGLHYFSAKVVQNAVQKKKGR